MIVGYHHFRKPPYISYVLPKCVAIKRISSKAGDIIVAWKRSLTKLYCLSEALMLEIDYRYVKEHVSSTKTQHFPRFYPKHDV